MLYTTTIKPYRDKLNLGPEYYKRLRENLSQDKFSKEILSPSYLPLVEAIGERWHKYERQP